MPTKVGHHTTYNDDEIRLSTDDIEEPGYSEDKKGCGGQAAAAALTVLFLVLIIV